MKTHEFLKFRLRQVQYGIPIACVREIFPLPEITPAPEAPGDMIGLLNWRGKVLPVMHLDRRLGQPIQFCYLSDSVIVIDWQGIQVGMIVNQVEDVISLDEHLIESDISYGRENHINTAFLSGVAKIDADMLLLLNMEALIRLADDVAIFIWDNDLQVQAGLTDESVGEHQVLPPPMAFEPQLGVIDFYTSYCPEATAKERQIFAQRALELQQSYVIETQTSTKPIAVLRLADEYFGLDLGLVREFIPLPKIHPIPCCPGHILGNLNLRGEVVTLVDIKATLNLKTVRLQEPKVVITQVGNTVVGIAIDEIQDILYIQEEQISVVDDVDSWIQGVTPYNNRVVSILNLPQLLQSESLSVNDTV
jgi:purine-binding chemotaxis protein CheW